MTIKKRTLIKIFLIALVIFAALLVSAWFFASYQLTHLETYKASLTSTLSKALNRDVTYETGEATLTFPKGLALKFTGVAIRDQDRSSDLLNIETASVRVNLLPLLTNRISLGEVVLQRPRLSLRRNQSGVLNIADLLASDPKQKITVAFQKLTLEKGALTFLDQSATDKGLETSLIDISCRMRKSYFNNKLSFQMTAIVLEGKNRGELILAGNFRPAPSDKPVWESPVEIAIRLKGSDIQHYLPYLKSHAAIEHMAGFLDAETMISGNLVRFKAKGTFKMKDARLRYPHVFRGWVQSHAFDMDYTLSRHDGTLHLKVDRLAADGFAAAGRLALIGMDTDDPQLTAIAVSAPFSLKRVHAYIPWDIIPGGVGDFIWSHIPDGDFRLIEGKLAGRLSQIKNMNRPENAGVLSIRAEVNKGVFVVGNSTPEFHDLSGNLLLINRQFMLKNIKGLFGTSPLTVEGGISDFARLEPTVYNAEMTLEPARSEILWLLGKEQFRDLSFDGLSTLHLSGKGPAENHLISARWDLTHAAYTFPKVIEKPAGRANELTCKIILNPDHLRVPSFHYHLPPITVSGTAVDLFADKKSITLNVQSKAFDIGDIAPLLPFLQTLDPSGTCFMDLSGHGNLGDPSSFRWTGNMSLADVSLKPPGNVNPITGLTGKAAFTGSRMQTSLFNAHVGDSPFQMKCGIDDLRKPKVACQLDAALFRTTDMGLQSSAGEINLQNLKGKFTFEDEYLHVDRLSFRLEKSRFNLSGDVRNFENPKITASLHSRYIDWNDVTRLMTLKNPKHTGDASSKPEINADVQVDAGIFEGVAFSKLNARLKFASDILTIETLEADLFEGSLKGTATVHIRPDGPNYYQSSLSLERISLDQVQGYLELDDRTVTGKLSLAGKITAAGNNLDDFKKTAEGTFQIRADKGVLKKFSVFSKIFSLLNVSQLMKLQFPDMAKDGMPYNAITGDVSIKEGVLSSKNFFIAGEAMQISIAGKIDFLKKELDHIVGVHPLKTVDWIVGKIPVAGWLLTDEKGNLITVHFKVDGTWDDPRVSPMPVQSIAKGTLDIFRRLFQLPEKLVTDTGDVILGH